jgi:hypothetical protein
MINKILSNIFMGPFIDSQIMRDAEFKKVNGLGSDTNEKLAYVKAVVEILSVLKTSAIFQ